jgi:hypothetical protein
VRKFSVRPTLTLQGRTFMGLRGWARELWHAGTYTFTAGDHSTWHKAEQDFFPGGHD